MCAIQTTEFDSIQNKYLAQIDSRMRLATSVAKMNAELAASQLLSDAAQTVDAFDRSYAGFPGGIGRPPVRPEKGLVAITFGIHTGGNCNFDETLPLYTRNSLRRIARINAEHSYTHGYHLREVAAGEDDPRRGRMIGSAWVASNCTSNWNGNIFRIDLLRGQSLRRFFMKE